MHSAIASRASPSCAYMRQVPALTLLQGATSQNTFPPASPPLDIPRCSSPTLSTATMHVEEANIWVHVSLRGPGLTSQRPLSLAQAFGVLRSTPKTQQSAFHRSAAAHVPGDAACMCRETSQTCKATGSKAGAFPPRSKRVSQYFVPSDTSEPLFVGVFAKSQVAEGVGNKRPLSASKKKTKPERAKANKPHTHSTALSHGRQDSGTGTHGAVPLRRHKTAG